MLDLSKDEKLDVVKYLRLPPSLNERLERLSEVTHLSVAELIRRGTARYVEEAELQLAEQEAEAVEVK